MGTHSETGSRLEAASQKSELQTAELITLKSSLEESTAELDQLKRQIEELRAEGVKTGTAGDLHGVLQSGDTTELEEALKDQNATIEALQNELAQAKQKNAEHEQTGSASTEALTIELDQLREALNTETAAKMEVNAQVEEYTRKNESLVDELGVATMQQTQSEEQLTQMGAEMEMYKLLAEELQKCSSEDSSAELKASLEAKDAELVTANAKIIELEARLNETPEPVVAAPAAPTDTPFVYEFDSLAFKDKLGLQQKRKAIMVVENMKKGEFAWEMAEGVCRALFVDQSMANMKIAWSVCDRDNKGKLDLGDFKKALPTMGERIPADEVELLFGMADEDGSGCITFSEFVMLLRAMNLK
eukprot:TRINITY_DN11491_c0_g1_i2.p1 TRINITY_DN11491_c0_g1~~TRINITY_DN11491_c0_g1_i2.p1  ORF type:complete len:360 (+),score=109.66 TRINITY_DN11491_c0_g1_i2:454-1533(+)